jgi:class 3 adenylate cyclase
VSESVELATILLTDLVGSTRLATALGPVRADELRDEHFAVLREATAACGGREVKNTGDGLMVAFSSASAAVRCAVKMQQLFERRYRTAEQQLHIRIGLGAGESTVQDGDYFGMPSIEAARLCDKAPTDGILISPAVRMLAGRYDGAEFESVGELELKGFNEPMEAFAVTWSPPEEDTGGSGRWPLPALLRSVPGISYVGREVERGLIEQIRGEVRSGTQRVVLLAGEPGIGKTRLAAYEALGAHGEGFAVCWGRCSEELAVPYEPWIEVCSQLVEHAPDELLAGYVDQHGGELSRLVRNLAKRIPDLPAPQSSDLDTERFLLFSAVAGLVAAVGEGTPVCLVLDDLQSADGQSIALLGHLVRTVDRGSLLLIAAYRDSELGKDHPLTGVLADLRKVEGVERIALHGLGPDEVAQVLSVVAGHALDQDGLALAGRIATETDGNPFFVGEVLLNLSESGTLQFDEAIGRWRIDRSAPLGLPESVREVIERRVERLGEETRELLVLAAVIGRSFEVELLLALADVSETQLLDLLDAAVGALVLEESTDRVGVFRFAHALINQTLYQALGGTRRARMHQRIAEALEALCGDDPGEHLAELALHWRLAAASVQKYKAADYAYRAGEQALKRLAPAEAAKLFGDAVELLGEEETADRCRALIGLGRAQRLSGESYRATVLEASRIASALADPDLAASAVLANSRGYTSVIGEVDTSRLGAIERAIELDDGSHPGRRARLLSLQAVELAYDPDLGRRRPLIEEALRLARQADDSHTLIDVIRGAEYADWSPATLARRAELVEELIALVDAAQDPTRQFAAYIIELDVAIELGQFQRVEAALRHAVTLAGELGRPVARWFAAYYSASWAVWHGDLAAGEELTERALRLGQEAAQPDAPLVYAIQLVPLRIFQGRGQEIIAMIEQAVDTYKGLPAFRATLAFAYCWLDRKPDAAAIVEQAAGDGFDHISWDPVRLMALVLYGDAAAQAGVKDAAATLYGLIEPWADQLVTIGTNGWGHTRMYLGTLAAALGRQEQAEEHFGLACDFHDSNGLALWAAMSRLRWAEALALRAEPARALEQATRALRLARQHGYPPIEQRAAAIVETGAPART